MGLATPQGHSSHLFQKPTAPVKMDANFVVFGGTDTPIQDKEGHSARVIAVVLIVVCRASSNSWIWNK